jgi:hypothetical protein
VAFDEARESFHIYLHASPAQRQLHHQRVGWYLRRPPVRHLDEGPTLAKTLNQRLAQPRYEVLPTEMRRPREDRTDTSTPALASARAVEAVIRRSAVAPPTPTEFLEQGGALARAAARPVAFRGRAAPAAGMPVRTAGPTPARPARRAG